MVIHLMTPNAAIPLLPRFLSSFVLERRQHRRRDGLDLDARVPHQTREGTWRSKAAVGVAGQMRSPLVLYDPVEVRSSVL